VSVVTGGGPGAAPLNAEAYLLGAVLVLPVLVRNRYPRFELLACSVLLLLYYTFDRRDISPAPLLSVPLYDAAVAGFLVAAIVIPAVYMAIGLVVVELSNHSGLVALINDFLPSIVVLALAIVLGDTVRSRRALAAETAERLRVAHEEREAEAARRVAEERLRIARDLHDTVAHSMATITVQAGSALHVLGDRDEKVRKALTAIRETSKHALGEMRTTLGQLREGTPDGAIPLAPGGLDRLPALREAVTAAGAPVTIAVEGEQRRLPPAIDEVAYRILQESLTNVLRHAGPAAQATVRLSFEPTALAITVTDDGIGPNGDHQGQGPVTKERGLEPSRGSRGVAPPGQPGHGLTGMAERAAAVGGRVTAGPRGEGGFEVSARLPLAGEAG
jgi:signal transduction histidine kinase